MLILLALVGVGSGVRVGLGVGLCNFMKKRMRKSQLVEKSILKTTMGAIRRLGENNQSRNSPVSVQLKAIHLACLKETTTELHWAIRSVLPSVLGSDRQKAYSTEIG